MLTKLRPLDILFHLINQSQDMRVFTEFFDRYVAFLRSHFITIHILQIGT